MMFHVLLVIWIVVGLAGPAFAQDDGFGVVEALRLLEWPALVVFLASIVNVFFPSNSFLGRAVDILSLAVGKAAPDPSKQ